ncbi:MAG TPA: hypothetical protein VFW85_08265, partial [Gaiellaceae bacterium]|nr:hypothetical protein [Gaiellaceae bacterium]
RPDGRRTAPCREDKHEKQRAEQHEETHASTIPAVSASRIGKPTTATTSNYAEEALSGLTSVPLV